MKTAEHENEEGEGSHCDGPRQFLFVRDMKDGDQAEKGCVAVVAAGRRRLFRLLDKPAVAVREILAEIVAEEGEMGQEYGIRSGEGKDLVIEKINRPLGPRADYNDVGEINDPKFYGGPTPAGWLAVV